MKRTSSSSRARRGLLRVAVVAALFLSSAPRANAQQVSLTIGYPPAAPTGATNPSPASAGPSPRGVAAALAYAQYLQYLQALNYAALRGGTASDVQQYFTNGAAATTVPSAGQPGSSYFTNGAEATVLRPPSAPSASAPPPTPTATTQPSPAGPYPWPFVPAPPQGPPVGRAPEAAPAPAAPMDVEPSTAPVEVAESQPPPAPVTAMSFEAWLASMGLSPSEEATATDVSTTVSEPAFASGAIARASFAPREKPRKRADAVEGNGGLVAAVASAFATGLLLGGLAMFRLRSRRRAAIAPTS
jgi:hypothetical protein